MGDSTTAISPYLCGTTQEYTFCASTGSGDAMVVVPPQAPPKDDVRRIQGWFGARGGVPEPVPNPPKDVPVPKGARAYRVTHFLPRIFAARNGTREEGVGPNCYQTALTSAGYPDVQGRYVDGAEFRYYLLRDYATVACSSAPYGAFVVYDTSASAYEAGDHAAFQLLGSLVFQKGSWERNYPYEVATRDGAMKAVDSHWVPRREDRFGGGSKPNPHQVYQSMCYQRRATPVPRKTSSQKTDRSWFQPLMRYYSRRLAEAAQLKWSEFPAKRIDLLTIENMWRVSRGFSDRVGNFNPLKVLLAIDDDIARDYLKLESLSWQYQAMVNTYDPIRDGTATRQLEELYRKHYVTFDQNFYEELRLYLRLLEVPEKKWPPLIDAVVKKIKSYDPVEFSQSGGGRGIPYLDILKEAIRAHP
jgi:hypothetical protein